MRKPVAFPFLLLGLFLFIWINLPKSFSDRIRAVAVAPFRVKTVESGSVDLGRLQVENHQLRTQLEQVYERLKFDQRICEQFDFLKPLSEKRMAHLKEIFIEQLSSVPAQVIYRDPSSWSSSLWVNVGEENNRSLGVAIIAKNSPVLADGALVGVVDYVGEKQARIRLITDSGLSPSVRVARGGTQNRELAHQLQVLLNQLEKRSDLFAKEGEKAELIGRLQNLKERTGTVWEDGYLAKGEVHGSSAPFWRSRGPILKGVGFNFDFPDDEGPLRGDKSAVSMIKEGDLLVTSGLDGVFPPGLRVGTVAFVEPMKEGGYAYEIEVRPAVTHLNDLQTVFILPSLE